MFKYILGLCLFSTSCGTLDPLNTLHSEYYEGLNIQFSQEFVDTGAATEVREVSNHLNDQIGRDVTFNPDGVGVLISWGKLKHPIVGVFYRDTSEIVLDFDYAVRVPRYVFHKLIRHEIGHAFVLIHVEDLNDIMAPNIHSRPTVSESELIDIWVTRIKNQIEGLPQ